MIHIDKVHPHYNPVKETLANVSPGRSLIFYKIKNDSILGQDIHTILPNPNTNLFLLSFNNYEYVRKFSINK